MALRPHMGNQPKLDTEKFATGTLTSVSVVTKKEENGEWQSYRWEFEAEGTLRPFPFSELTGMAMYPPDEKGQLNKLTTIVVKLGILTVEQLESGEEPDCDLESAIGRLFKCKVYRKDGFYRIDWESLRLDE